eukprot:6150778-Karenia_brevis.AAC.1
MAQDFPFDGFAWLLLNTGQDEQLWVGGVYVPGPSDIRFRRVQGVDSIDHYQSMARQLEERVGQRWLLGGDFNSITQDEQCTWHPVDLLDHR